MAYGGACNQLRIAVCNCPGAYCKKGNIDDTPPKLTLITMYIPVESMKPFFRLMRSGRNFLSGFAMQTLLPSKASTRVRTRDTLSRQGDALVRTLHVLVSNSLPQKWTVQEKSFRILRLKATCGGDAASSWRMLQNVSKFKSLPFSEISIQPTVLQSTKMENYTNKLQHTHGHSSEINYLQVSHQLLTAAVGVHPTIWPMSVWRLTVARKLQMGAFQAG